MRRMLTSMLLVTVFLGTAACGGGGDPAEAGASTSSSGGDSSSDSPSTSPTASSSESPASSGSSDVDCLVSGSPWQVSVPDLESQFPRIMRGIDVTNVRIEGRQTVSVDSSLHVTITDNSTTAITVALSHGLTMVVEQRHRGSTSGSWEAQDSKLVSAGSWTGRIRGSTKVTINGRAGQAPFDMPSAGLGNHPTTFTCADGTLNLTVDGSPFSFLLTSA